MAAEASYAHVLRGYHHMHVVFIGSDSNESKEFETALLRRIVGSPKCDNKSLGGESPSPGTPHFCYIVVQNASELWRHAGVPSGSGGRRGRQGKFEQMASQLSRDLGR